MLKTVSKFIQLIFLLFLVAGAYHAYGQVYPVQVTTQIVPPYTPYLSDYTAPGSQRMMMNFVLRDPTLPEYRCKLRITIEGVGITIRTKASYVPEALVLPGGGVPTLLYGEDLLEYFKPDNLDFAGITRNQYEKGAKLPEGIYRFTVEVLDYNRNTVVSNKGTATAWVILNDPPLLNLPRKDTKVQILDPTNIPFTWTPRHTGSPNAAFTTEYVFRLVEVWPITRNPYDAFLSQPVLYEVTSNVPQIIYDMAAPALLPGRKYAWQVQARDVEGRDLFKNDGRSEVYVFQFGDALGIPEALTLQSSTSSALTVRWDQPAAGSDAVTYRTRYRPHNNRTHDDWYEGTTNDQWKTLSSLQPNTEYEVQVRAEQTMQTSDYSATGVFKTAEAGASDFACKSDVQPPPTPASTTPTFPLNVNDTIHAGGYDVLVRGLTASGKTYTGEGFAMVPWLHGAKVRVTFKDIAVNSQFWLTSGEIKSVWNADSKFLINVPSKDNPANTPNTGDIPVTVVATDSVVKIKDAAIATVTKDPDGNIVVSTTDGNTTVLEKGKSYSIVDDIGNGYVVDKEGNITKTTAEQALAAADRGNRNYNIGLTFNRGGGRFGFDAKKYEALNSFYQQLDGGDYIAWKAVSSSQADGLDAVTSGDFKKENIRFEISGAQVMPVSTSGNTLSFNVLGKAEGSVEELLAMYPSSTEPTKNEVVGKLNLISYDKISNNLVIVPVNNTGLPGGISETTIQAELNRIYGQAVADWKVSIAQTLKVGLDDMFDDGETGLLSNYTGDMKAVINAYGRLQDKTYYLFLVTNPKSGSQKYGYMPRNKQAGFIFMSNVTGETVVTIMAHELGHGAFNLQHTFDEFNLENTDNLMDYQKGTVLCKYQWDYVHDPQRVISLFEDDEDSEYKAWSLLEGDVIASIPGYENVEKSFLSVAGEIITLPANARDFTFIDGYLVKFTIGDERYVSLTGTATNKVFGYFYNAVRGKDDSYTITAETKPYTGVLSDITKAPEIFYVVKDPGGCGSYEVRKATYKLMVSASNNGGVGKVDIQRTAKTKLKDLATTILDNHQSVAPVSEPYNCLTGRAKEVYKFIVEHYTSNNVALDDTYKGNLIAQLKLFDLVAVKGLDAEVKDGQFGYTVAIKMREMLKYGHLELLANLTDKTAPFASQPSLITKALVIEFEDYERIKDAYMVYKLVELLDAECSFAEDLRNEINKQMADKGKVEFNLDFFMAVGKTTWQILSGNEAFELISCLLDKAHAPESLYNPNRLDYVFQGYFEFLFETALGIDQNSLLAQIQAGTGQYPFACACGAWNAVVDLVIGVSKLGELVTKDPVTFVKDAKEAYNNITNAGFSGLGEGVWTMLKEHHGYVNGYGVDSYQATYGGCYDVITVASFFIGIGEIKALSEAGKLGDLGEMGRIIMGAAKAYPKNVVVSLKQLVAAVSKLSGRAMQKVVLQIVERAPTKLIAKLPADAKAIIIATAMDVELVRFSDEGMRILQQSAQATGIGKTIIYQSTEKVTDIATGKTGILKIVEEDGRIVAYIDEIAANLRDALRTALKGRGIPDEFLDEAVDIAFVFADAHPDRADDVVTFLGNITSYQWPQGDLAFYSVSESLQNIMAKSLFNDFPSIPREEVLAIHHYTRGVSFPFNQALRSGENMTSFFKVFDEFLRNGLNKLPNYNGKVYRATSLDRAYVISKYEAAMKNGTTITEAAYTSTSKVDDFIPKYMERDFKATDIGVVFEIQSTAGKDIEEISLFGSKFGKENHKEVLLLPGSEYNVTKFELTTNAATGKTYYTIGLQQIK